MAGSITDIVSAVQNSVVAMNNFAKQLTGSFNNISGQLTSLSSQLTNLSSLTALSSQVAAIQSAYVISIAGNSSAFTLNGASGITNSVNDIILSEASSTQFGAVKVDGTTITAAAGVISAAFPSGPITNSLSSDHLTNNIANYFDGPTIAQGSSGKWWVSGTVTVADTASASTFYAKLWDGTTVIDSAATTTQQANASGSIAVSGFITNPAGNLRISVREPVINTGKMEFNVTGNSKDCTISAFRIG